jgi:plasmid maintenance system antidote protein VapI
MQRFRLTQHEICRVIGIPVSTFNRLIRGDKCLGHVASDALIDPALMNLNQAA